MILSMTNALAIVMVFTALYSAVTRRLASQIARFRLQSLALSFLALLNITVSPWTIFVAGILLTQFVSIQPFLAYLTLNVVKRQPGQSWYAFLQERVNTAKVVWLEYNPHNNPRYDPKTGKYRASPLFALVMSGSFVFFAFVMAGLVLGNNDTAFTGLGSSLALLVIGMFMMINAYDILSLVMGLLVMQNGTFLATLIVFGLNPIVFGQNSILYFLFAMIASYGLTFWILTQTMPRLKHFSGSIYIDKQKTLRE